MKQTIVTLLGSILFGFVAVGATSTFDQIKFNTETYSSDDPLGVNAIKVVQDDVVAISNKAEAAETKATQAEAKATSAQNAIVSYTNTMSSALTRTDDAIVIGSVKGTSDDIAISASSNSIVIGVQRDISELDVSNGEILFAADKIRFDGTTSSIWIGSSTLATILSDIQASAGQGEMNTISSISTNGVALVPDGNKVVNIVIPEAGEMNTITGITLNGNVVTPSDKVVAIDAATKVVTSTNGVEATYDQNNGTITLPEFTLKATFDNHKHTTSDITDFNDSVTALIPAAGDANVIETVKVNGTALTVNDKAVNVEVPVINGLQSIPGAEVAATNAIAEINAATSIAEIKTALTNFLNTFKTPVAP